MELFFWLIIFLIDGFIFGLITTHVATSKGYTGGFWWGFFLGIVGLLVVGFKPNINQQYEPRSSSEHNTLASSPSASANIGGWTCICGAENPTTIDYCLSCRRSKAEGNIPKKICPHCGKINQAKNSICFACNTPLDGYQSELPQNADNLTPVNKEESSDYFAALEKLAELHEQGILTDEEFQQKKADVLAKI